jgi:sulfur transfer complex TusBCD TusB component (DsrH family)
MKALSIIESAYRATIEEQDDTIVWINHAMRAAGAELTVLLRGNAVSYAVAAQAVEGLAFGDWRQTQPPRLADDVAALIAKDVAVHVVAEDLTARGIGRDELIDGVRLVTLRDLTPLLMAHDQVWHW